MSYLGGVLLTVSVSIFLTLFLKVALPSKSFGQGEIILKVVSPDEYGCLHSKTNPDVAFCGLQPGGKYQRMEIK